MQTGIALRGNRGKGSKMEDIGWQWRGEKAKAREEGNSNAQGMDGAEGAGEGDRTRGGPASRLVKALKPCHWRNLVQTASLH